MKTILFVVVILGSLFAQAEGVSGMCAKGDPESAFAGDASQYPVISVQVFKVEFGEDKSIAYCEQINDCIYFTNGEYQMERGQYVVSASDAGGALELKLSSDLTKASLLKGRDAKVLEMNCLISEVTDL